MIKCPECNKEISEQANNCPNCGFPLKKYLKELEKKEKKELKENKEPMESKKKKNIIISLIVCVAIVLGIGGYVYLNRDVTPPTINGVDKIDNIKIQCGTEFNLKDYVKDKIKVTDDRDTNLEYTISVENEKFKDLYNNKTGAIDTSYVNNFTMKISAQDKAENKTTKKFTITLEPIHVTVDNLNPLIYDGKYAKIELKEFNHGFIQGTDGYQVLFKVENKSDDYIVVYLPSDTSINKYQVGAFYTVNSIAPGATGIMESAIRDEDIPDDIGKIISIDSTVCIMNEKNEKYLTGIPIVFDVNAVKHIDKY